MTRMSTLSTVYELVLAESLTTMAMYIMTISPTIIRRNRQSL
jgi:hypothetical protein